MKWLIAILFFSNISLAAEEATICIELEGMNIGCIPTIDHTCKLNRMTDIPQSVCDYGSNYGTHYRVEAPIAFNCKSSKSTTTCTEDPTNPDGGTNCITSSECIEYFPPSCKMECIGCYNNRESAGIGAAAGCNVCTRPYCPDEPMVTKYCPLTYNGMTLTTLPKCNSGSRCPDTATDPLGVEHIVNVTIGSCPDEPKPPTQEPPYPKQCPWLTDERSEDGCEEIRPENKNPKAF